MFSTDCFQILSPRRLFFLVSLLLIYYFFIAIVLLAKLATRQLLIVRTLKSLNILYHRICHCQLIF